MAGSVESQNVTAARAAWIVGLETSASTVAAGAPVTLTAEANQNVGLTDGTYVISILDTTTGSTVRTCTSGTVCAAAAPSLYSSNDNSHEFIAVVSAPGSFNSLEDVVDAQAVSTTVTIGRAVWEGTVTTDLTNVELAGTVTGTVTVDQDVADTEDRYSLYLFDAVSGAQLRRCDTGNTCQATVTWRSADWALVFVGMVAERTPDPIVLGEAQGLLYGEQVFVGTPSWSVDMAADKGEIGPNESVGLTATTNLDVGLTDGALAVYIIEAISERIVARCTTGTTCSVDDEFYKPTDMLWAGHSYWAWVADNNPDAEFYQDVQRIRAGSNSVSVQQRAWEGSAQQTGHSSTGDQFLVRLNQSMSVTNGRVRIVLVDQDNGSTVDSCTSGSVCMLQSDAASTYGYFIGIEGLDYQSHAEPGSEYSWVSMGGWGFAGTLGPASGPVLPGESAGGGNPAEQACQCEHADPVNSATGEFYETTVDLKLQGVGPGVEVSRTYSSSGASSAGAFGFGWASTLEPRLEPTLGDLSGSDLPQQIQVVQENGSTTLFTGAGQSSYSTLPRVHAELIYDESNEKWIYTRNHRDRFTFDAHGTLVEESDRNGNRLLYSHDVAGKLTSISTPDGRTITFAWTADRITNATDSAGREVAYSYDEAGNLAAVTDVDGKQTSYTYDGDHRLVATTLADGGVVTNAFDAEGRMQSQTDQIGRTTQFSYDDNTNDQYPRSNTVANPDGTITTDVYVNQRIVSQTVATGTDLEATTAYEYDTNGNLIAETSPSGATNQATYDDDGNKLTETNPLGKTTTRTYNADGDLLTITDPVQRVSTFTYDTRGNILTHVTPGGSATEFARNNDGTIATRTDPREMATTYTYTAAGLPATVTDPEAGISQYEYNSAGNLSATTDPNGHTSTTTVTASGNELTSTDADGNTTTYSYDAVGNLTTVTQADASTYSGTYDLAGQLTSRTDTSGRTTSFTYTPAGKLATETTGDAITTYTYDNRGRKATVTDPTGRTTGYEYDPDNHPTVTHLPSGATTTNSYTQAGQLAAFVDGRDNTSHNTYDEVGQLIATEDGLGRITSIHYTDDGKVDTITHPDSNTTEYEYDPSGNLTSFTNPDGKQTVYTYSDADRRISETLPGGLTTTYAYDDAGQVLTTTSPDGTTSTFSYTNTGLVSNISRSEPGSTDTAFEYNQVGQVTQMTDATGLTEYDFNDAGQLETETTTAGEITNEYDSYGNRIGITYPSGHHVTYAYDLADRMTAATDWAARTSTFSWDANGNLATVAHPNGLTQTYTRDAADNITQIDASNTSGPLLTLDYSYDEAGQLTNSSRTDSAGSSTVNFTYDLVGQLHDTDTALSYDATSAGLLTTAGMDVLAYNSAQQVTERSIGTTTLDYGYDDDGRRVSEEDLGASGLESATMTYSAEGAIASYTKGASTVNYTNDGMGQRRSRTDANGTENWVWDTANAIQLLLDDGHDEFIYGPGTTPVAEINKTTGAIEYFTTDNVGSPRLFADETGAQTATRDYDPYGNLSNSTGATDSHVGYTGGWTDPVSGYVHLRARDYDPKTGQFTTLDPLREQTNSAYSYVRNNPLLLTDPTGLCAQLGSSNGNWTDKPGKIASKWGIPVDEIENAIEDLKQDGGKFGGKRRNPDVEINTETGDVRIKGGGDGESIGNLDDYLNSTASSMEPPQFDWNAAGVTVGTAVAVAIAGILYALNPFNAATA
ncbi:MULTISPECIES: RHS repeat-associated core domain-containing protein [unclassified Leifsonia]|uniref:RHS repeat-associated core domain-containing protein n=1 Tax=unclassified Leifsonia TaxID=2663824 RepID=UPI00138F2FA1|nr:MULTISPECIES: RHS repeat-associated core domain-containing protein [unclassified Leifsonia]